MKGKPEGISPWALEPNWKTGKTIYNRFMDLCMPEPNSGCWLWLGNIERESKPYGRMDISGRSEQAHRISYMMFNGEIGDDLFVCHRCDNPSCVNPDHLFVGTPKENSGDRDSKRRNAYGAKSGKSKLTIEQVLQIREASGTCRAIAEKFGVNNVYVSRIRRGLAWKQAIDDAAIRKRGQP